MVRNELTSEEKFFEKAVVTEKFLKKYKNLIVAGVIATALFIAGNVATPEAVKALAEAGADI